MADTKISALSALAAADALGTDYIPIVDDSLVAGSPATANKKITLDVLRDWLAKEVRQTVALSAGVLNIDYNEGQTVYVSLNANVTDINFSNWPASGTLGKAAIRFTADGTLRTIAFSSIATTVKAEGGVAPTVPDANGEVLWIHILSDDALTSADVVIGSSALSAI